MVSFENYLSFSAGSQINLLFAMKLVNRPLCTVPELAIVGRAALGRFSRYDKGLTGQIIPLLCRYAARAVSGDLFANTP